MITSVRYRLFSRYLGGGIRHQPAQNWINHIIAFGSVFATLYVLWIGALSIVFGDAVLWLFDSLAQGGLVFPALNEFAGWARGYTANFHRDISVFIGVTFPIAFLTTTSHRDRTWLGVSDVIGAVLSLAVAAYYLVFDERFLNWSYGFSHLTVMDMVVGLTLVVLVMELCRRCTGWGLFSLVVVLLLFTIFGSHLSGPLRHENFHWHYFFEMMTVTDNGIFGSPLQVAATYAFLFVLFGNFYEKTGGGELFYGLASALTGRMRGGAVKACVTSSGLYGSVSGSPTADVATTGPLTIPLMKRAGVSAERAAAIESTASSGGAMLPPVMGAVAFIMSDMTGLSYGSIALASLLPAVLYYSSIFIAVHNTAVRDDEGAMPKDQIPRLGKTLVGGWRHLLPLVALVSLLVMGFTPVYVAAGSTAAIIVLSWFSRESAIGPKRFTVCCTQTIFQIVPLVGAVAAAGLIIGSVEISGLAGKFTLLINYLAGGNLVATLLLSAVFLILLGMGMPTPAVYLTASALLAPVLSLSFELPLMQLHLFILYFACLSAITPPIAVANFAAGAIAGADPMAVGRQAIKLALGGFIIPFFFLFNPALNMEGDFYGIAQAFVFCLAMIAFASLSLNGHLGKRLISPWVRLIFAATIVFLIIPSPIVQLGGLSVGLLFIYLIRTTAIGSRSVVKLAAS